MSRSINKPFLDSLNDKRQVIESFRSTTRIEYNLSTKYMIKRMLEVENVSLRSVLASKANPLLKLCQKIFDLDITHQGSINDFRAFKRIGEHYLALLLDKFQDDLSKAEEVLRHFYSARTNFRTKRKELVRIRNLRQNSKPIEPVELMRLFRNIANEDSV